MRNFVTILTVCLIAGASLLSAKPSLAYGHIVTVEPESVAAGESVRICGESFTPSIISGSTSEDSLISYVAIYFPDRGSLVRKTAIDSWGQFDISFEPGEYPAGTYTLWIHDESAGASGWVAAELTIKTNITLSTYSGYEGDNITVRGTGFTPSTLVKTFYNGKPISSAYSDINGSFTDEGFIIPVCSSNESSISASDVHEKMAVALFTTRHQKLLIMEQTVFPGSEISMYGTGFTPDTGLVFTLHNTGVIFAGIPSVSTGIVTDRIGSFYGSLRLPECTADSYIIEVTDGVYHASIPLEITQRGALNRYIGFIGSEVSISGIGFVAENTAVVSFDGNPIVELQADAGGSVTGLFTVPPCLPGKYPVDITDGIHKESFVFTVITRADITIDRESGYVGGEIIMNGTGFVAERLAVISYDDVPIAETTIDTSGYFTAALALPESPAGEHTVSVSDGINTLSTVVTIESQPPPPPMLVTPQNCVTQEPEVPLEWEEVPDASGVRYTVQVAGDESFSPDSIILEKSNVMLPEYVFVPPQESIGGSESPSWSWRVRAVDFASNIGDWSEVRTFSIDIPGFSLFSYGLIGEVTALGGLFVFWLVKKRRRR